MEEDGQCFRNVGMGGLTSTGIRESVESMGMIHNVLAAQHQSHRVKYLPHSHSRDWVDYRDGFGDFKQRNDEFWLGNEYIYSLLSEGRK